MKVLLINAPFPKYTQGYEPPIHIAYLAAYLKERGCEVDIVDAGLRGSAQETVADADDGGFAAIYVDIHNIFDADEIARALKERDGGIKVAVWGNLPTAIPKRVLEENPHIDFAIKREPELTLAEIVERCENGKGFDSVLGCAARLDGGIVEFDDRPLIDDLDALPDADRALLARKNSYPPFIGPLEGYVLTSRGCPHSCNFCSALLHGKFRRRTPMRVVDEIERTNERFGVKRFVFRDYTMTPRSHITGICDEILRRNLDISWHCLVRVDLLDEELLSHMKRAGCFEVNFGIESADRDVLDSYNKGITVEQVRSAFELCRKVGIETMGNIMLGGPYDTPQSIRSTLDLFVGLDPDRACITLFFPYPETPIWRYCKERNLIKTEDWSRYFTDPWDDRGHYDRVLALPPEVVRELERGYRRLLFRYFKKHARKFMRNPLHVFDVRLLHLRQLAQYVKFLRNKGAHEKTR